MSKLKKEITPSIIEFSEFEDKYFVNEETEQLEFENENKQLEIDKFEDDVNIYNLIEKYENGDLLIFDRKKDIADREPGKDGFVDLTDLPKDLTDYSKLLKEIEELKTKVAGETQKQDLETAAAEEITKTVITNQEQKEESKGDNE